MYDTECGGGRYRRKERGVSVGVGGCWVGVVWCEYWYGVRVESGVVEVCGVVLGLGTCSSSRSCRRQRHSNHIAIT